MKMIVGLGNPGAEYAKTRHNVGFMCIDALADRIGVDAWREWQQAVVCDAHLGAEKVVLVKPWTYMNESGRAVGSMMSYFKLDPADLIVIYDDMDIPCGTVRIRRKGSAGGHNGIKSILSHVGREDFARVRIGIGRPLSGWTVVDHVLAPFMPEDLPKVKDAIDYLLPAVECMVSEGVDSAMNRFNPRKEKKKREVLSLPKREEHSKGQS